MVLIDAYLLCQDFYDQVGWLIFPDFASWGLFALLLWGFYLSLP